MCSTCEQHLDKRLSILLVIMRYVHSAWQTSHRELFGCILLNTKALFLSLWQNAMPAHEHRCLKNNKATQRCPLKDLVVSLNKGTQYRPQNTIILIMGTPKKVPLILGNYHLVLPANACHLQLVSRSSTAPLQLSFAGDCHSLANSRIAKR